MHKVLEKLRLELTEGIIGLSAEDTQTRRAPEKWTIQQIVDHLLLSYAATSQVATVRLEKRAPTKASPSLSQRLGQFMVATCGIFPKGRLAPPAVFPQQTSQPLTGGELAVRLEEYLVRMDRALTQAEDLFGPSCRAISHTALGPMNITQWRRFHLVHGEHHLKQIASTPGLIHSRQT